MTPVQHRILPNYTGPRLFGAPVGDFSLIQTLLATLAVGAASFFAGTFLGIVGLVVASSVQHRMLDFSLAYRWIGLSFGVLMLVLTGGYLGTIFVQRLTRKT